MIREDQFYEALGRAIKARREDLHLTQGDLAKHLRLSRTSITNIERGRQRLLVDQFCQVAEALHCDYDTLLLDALHKNPRLEKKSMPSVDNFVESVTANRSDLP